MQNIKLINSKSFPRNTININGALLYCFGHKFPLYT